MPRIILNDADAEWSEIYVQKASLYRVRREPRVNFSSEFLSIYQFKRLNLKFLKQLTQAHQVEETSPRRFFSNLIFYFHRNFPLREFLIAMPQAQINRIFVNER